MSQRSPVFEKADIALDMGFCGKFQRRGKIELSFGRYSWNDGKEDYRMRRRWRELYIRISTARVDGNKEIG